jgi:uncharacterized membrane protein YeiB
MARVAQAGILAGLLAYARLTHFQRKPFRAGQRSRTMIDDAARARFLSALTEEYKALRAEGLILLQQQYVIAYWSVSAVVFLLVAIGSAWDKIERLAFAPALAFLVAMPTVLMGFAWSWSHVISGIARVGAHLFLLERKLAALLVGDGQFLTAAQERPERIPVSWEHVLWGRGSQAAIERTTDQVFIGLGVLISALWILGARMLGGSVWFPGTNLNPEQTLIALGTLILWIVLWSGLRNSLKYQINLTTDDLKRYRELSGELWSADPLTIGRIARTNALADPLPAPDESEA